MLAVGKVSNVQLSSQLQLLKVTMQRVDLDTLSMWFGPRPQSGNPVLAHLTQQPFGPRHLILQALLLELLQVLKVLLDIAVVLGEQRVQDDLSPAYVDSRAEVLLQLPARRVKIPLVVILGSCPATDEEQVPDVALFEVGQIREAGAQDVSDPGELLVDVLQVAHREEAGPARVGVTDRGDLGSTLLPL